MKLRKNPHKSTLFPDVTLASDLKSSTLLYDEVLQGDRPPVKNADNKLDIRSAPSSPRPLETAGPVTFCWANTISSDCPDIGSKDPSRLNTLCSSSKHEITVIENEQATSITNSKTYGLSSCKLEEQWDRPRRGVVISLSVDQLCYTVIEPGDIEKKWRIRSYGSILRYLDEMLGR